VCVCVVVGGRVRGWGAVGAPPSTVNTRARAAHTRTQIRTNARPCALVCERCCACRVGGVYGRNGPRPLRVPPRSAGDPSRRCRPHFCRCPETTSSLARVRVSVVLSARAADPVSISIASTIIL